MYSDSVFKKESESGHALQGGLFMRVPPSQLLKRIDKGFQKFAVDPQKPLNAHILDYISRSRKHVTRSTFSSELIGGCDPQDHGVLLATILHQVIGGAVSADIARKGSPESMEVG